MVDIPFLIPTAALGYSTLLFWGRPDGISRIFRVELLIPEGFLLVFLLHFSFSYPVIVRVMVGELLNYKEVYEIAARTLGAQPLTAVRTITLPLLKPGIIASFLLAFARSRKLAQQLWWLGNGRMVQSSYLGSWIWSVFQNT